MLNNLLLDKTILKINLNNKINNHWSEIECRNIFSKLKL